MKNKTKLGCKLMAMVILALVKICGLYWGWIICGI